MECRGSSLLLAFPLSLILLGCGMRLSSCVRLGSRAWCRRGVRCGRGMGLSCDVLRRRSAWLGRGTFHWRRASRRGFADRRRRRARRRHCTFRWRSLRHRCSTFRRCCVGSSSGVRSRLSPRRCFRRSLRLSCRRWLGPSIYSSWRGVTFLGQRLGDSNIRRTSAIGLGKRCLVGPGYSRVLRLDRGRSNMRFARRSLLGGCSRMLNAPRTAVVCRMIIADNRVLLHNCPVHISRMNESLIHMHHGGVVGKRAASPLATGKADATEPEPIVHAAIVAHLRAPIPVVESVIAIRPTPVRWRPKRAGIRRRHPRARHPVIVPIVA